MGKWINNHKQVVIVLLVIVPLAFVMINFLLDLSSKVRPPTKMDPKNEEMILFPQSDIEIKVEVADSPPERSRGLMEVEELPYEEGMLFIFEEKVRNGFWMKNTLISLDMIFVDENWKIVDIIEYAEPCEVDDCPKYQPSNLYQYVIEVNGGFTGENQIKEGDPVIFTNT